LSYRMMCLTAHPDDESGAFGGALLMAHNQGVETCVICLTDGAAGSFRGPACNGEELAQLRRAEFDEAKKALGLTHAEVLHYPDGALDGENFQELVRLFVSKIRQHRPQVVLTFGGDGGVNLHRDHTMVSVTATAAFHWAGRSQFFPDAGEPYAPQKLYYAGTPFVSVHNSPEISKAARVPWSLAFDLGKWKEQKIAAFKLHSSQRGVLERMSDRLEEAFFTERYLLVAARDERLLAEDDALFAGVIDD
jgi:LmbE family N-acetylglucosaminyl deacetylase